LLLHVLDLRGPADALPRRSVRAAHRARARRRPGADARRRRHRCPPRLRAHGVGGARLEHAVDPLLPAARGAAEPRRDPDTPQWRAAAPPGRAHARRRTRIAPTAARATASTPGIAPGAWAMSKPERNGPRNMPPSTPTR